MITTTNILPTVIDTDKIRKRIRETECIVNERGYFFFDECCEIPIEAWEKLVDLMRKDVALKFRYPFKNTITA